MPGGQGNTHAGPYANFPPEHEVQKSQFVHVRHSGSKVEQSKSVFEEMIINFTNAHNSIIISI